MRRIAQRCAVPFLLALVAAGASAPRASAACAGEDRLPAELGEAGAARVTLCLLNQRRAARGLPPLRADARLGRAAGGHAGDMVVRRYFAHTSKSGASFTARIARSGWMRSRHSWTVGENLAYGRGPLATPGAVVEAWMGSAGHRANILARRFRVVGIGVAGGVPTGGAGATYAADFGG